MDSRGKPRISRELLQRITKPQQSPQPIGLQTSSQMRQSFAERKQIDQNRRIVRAYKDSHLGTRSPGPSDIRQMGSEIGRKKPRLPARAPGSSQSPAIQKVDSKLNRPSAGFKEPPSSRFNPYP